MWKDTFRISNFRLVHKIIYESEI